MDEPQTKSSLRRLIESPVFLFFFSAFSLSCILYFPTVAIYALLWGLYFYLSSSTKIEDKTAQEVNAEEKYYKLLILLDDQITKKHSSNLISNLKDHFHPNIGSSSDQTSEEFLYILIDSIIRSKQNDKNNNNKFSLDEWLKSNIERVLPTGTNREFEYFVKNNREDIIRKIESSQEGWVKQLEIILSSKPRPDFIPFDYHQYPEHFQDKQITFVKRIDESSNNKRKNFSIIEGKKLWDLIHGDAEFFLKFDEYSTWYPKNSKLPFWLIPFSLYRWWTPDNDSFEDKFVMFGSLNLAKATKENMFNDPLYLFLSAYIKTLNSLNPILEIARLSTIIKDKFEAYCLIGLLQVEEIIKVDNVIYEEVVTQCINFLIDQKKFSWPLSAFVLNKEKYQIQLRQLLEAYCEEPANKDEPLNNDEICAISPYKDENGRFRLEKRLIYEIKGEKMISKSLNILNKKDFRPTFAKGIRLLFMSENYSRIIQLLVNYYLKWVAEVGHGHIFIVETMEKVNQNYPISEIDENTEEYKNYIILNATSDGLNPKTLVDEQTFNKAGDILRSGWKSYTLRRFVCSILIKQQGWENYLIEVDAIPEDETLTQKNLYDLDYLS